MVSARTTREVSETLSQCQKTNIGQGFISVMGYWPGMCKMLCSIPRTEEEMVERPFLPRWVHTENAEETMPTMPGPLPVITRISAREAGGQLRGEEHLLLLSLVSRTHLRHLPSGSHISFKIQNYS